MLYQTKSRVFHLLETLAALGLCLLVVACNAPPAEVPDAAADKGLSADLLSDTTPDATTPDSSVPDSGPTLPNLKPGWTIIPTRG